MMEQLTERINDVLKSIGYTKGVYKIESPSAFLCLIVALSSSKSRFNKRIMHMEQTISPYEEDDDTYDAAGLALMHIVNARLNETFTKVKRHNHGDVLVHGINPSFNANDTSTMKKAFEQTSLFNGWAGNIGFIPNEYWVGQVYDTLKKDNTRDLGLGLSANQNNELMSVMTGVQRIGGELTLILESNTTKIESVIWLLPPQEVHFEDEAVSNINGPAITWGSDKFYYIDGILIDEHVFNFSKPELLKWISTEGNVEIRRCLQKKYGLSDYLKDCGATIIDMDSIASDKLAPNAGQIMRMLVAEKHGSRFLVASDGSTDRVYYIRVPSRIQTCNQAHKFLMGGLEPKNIILEV